jgi:hypothetical protein
MNSSVIQWAIRHQVSAAALEELRAIWGDVPERESCEMCDKGLTHVGSQCPLPGHPKQSEAYVQSKVRLEAARLGVKLWRNNVGVLLNPKTGQPVRYGLANDSKRLNSAVKSGDLIGWRSVLITPAHVGSRIAQFLSRECKRPGWRYTGDEHEQAQLKWTQAVLADGGDACFVSGEGSL